MTGSPPTDLWLFLVLVTGGTYRLTRLATRDTITDPVRDFIHRRFTGSLVNGFTRCSWCVSVWIAAGLTAAAYWWWPWFRWALIAATASAVVGWLAEKEG